MGDVAREGRASGQRRGGASRRSRVVLARLALAAVLSVAFAALGSASPATADVPAGVEVINQQQVSPRVLELTVSTPAFAEPTRLHVNLPAGYDDQPSSRWPVTYFTAGTMNRYSAFNEALDGESLTADYPSILVSPDANSGYWSDWFNAGAFGPPMYETFVIDQLIPLIDERFRTVADRSHRAIFGISMGGYGAMMLAARHPDLFSAAASLSGAVDSNLPVNGAVLSLSSTFDGAPRDAIYGPRATQEVRWRGHNPTDLARNLRGIDLQVRSANGTLNPAIGEGGDPNDSLSCAVEAGTYAASVNFHEALEDAGVPHSWVDYGDGCHSRANFLREVTDTLEVFESHFADPPPRPAGLDYRSIEPVFEVRGWKVRADPERALEFMRLRASGLKATLEGSGRTRVTTPARYRGLKWVSVNGQRRKVGRDGRLRFVVDLGKANRVQQYTPDSSTTARRRTLRLEPHAVIRITSLKWSAKGLRVCARSIGGPIPRAYIGAGQDSLWARLTAEATCRTLRPGIPLPRIAVLIAGADRFGHVDGTIRFLRRGPRV